MNWNIVINGFLVGDEQELREQIEPLLTNEANLNAITADILDAANGTQPSEALNQWMEREPGITACVDFQQRVAQQPEQMDLRQTPVDAQLATVAATSLMAGFEDNLIMTEEGGFLLINNENPPPIEGAGEIFRRLFQIATAAERLDEFGKWHLGSLIDSCEMTYGENFSITQFVTLTERNYNTTVTCANTYRAFRNRRYNLSFTHHKEALYSKLPRLTLTDEDRHALMHRLMAISERFQLTCAEQRKLFSYANNTSIEAIDLLEEQISDEDMDLDEARDANMIVDRVDLVDRVTVRDANRNYLFRYQNRLYHHRGQRSALPQGATSIVCTDDWRQFAPNGAEQPVPQWESPGDPV